MQPNGYTCDQNGTFSFYIDQLIQMYAYGDENGILAETYIGYVNQSQADQIAQNTSRILIHYYRQSGIYNNGNSIFQYNPDRLSFLPTNNEVMVMPIFSARPNHRKNWLLIPHPVTQLYDTWLNGQNGFYAQTASWINDVALDGYVWYRYSDLLDVQQQLTVENLDLEEKIFFIIRKIMSSILIILNTIIK